MNYSKFYGFLQADMIDVTGIKCYDLRSFKSYSALFNRSNMFLDVGSASAIIEEADLEYIQAWLNESAQWAGRFNVYDTCAELIGETRLHLDIGCSLGYLLSRIHPKCPEAVLLGVESNATMVREAPEFLALEVVGASQAYIAPAKVTLDPDALARNDLIFQRKFKVDKSQLREIDFFRPGVISIIQDDIRTAEILKSILAGRRLDSASFMFPGTSPSAVMQYPYVFRKVDESTLRRRIKDIMKRIRSAVASFVTEYVKTGGVLVLTDRVNTSTVMTNQDYVNEVLGENAKCWDFDKRFVVKDVSKMETELEWSNGVSGAGVSSVNVAGLVGFRMIRNEVERPPGKAA